MKKLITIIFVLFSLVAYSQRLDHHTTNLPSLIVNQISVNGSDVYLATNDGVAKFDTVITAIEGVTGIVYSVEYFNNTVYIGQANKVGYYYNSNWYFESAVGNVNNIIPNSGYSNLITSSVGLQIDLNHNGDYTSILDGYVAIEGSPRGAKSGMVKYYDNENVKHVFYTNGQNLIDYNVKYNTFTNVAYVLPLTISHTNGTIYYARSGGVGKYDISTGAYRNLVAITGLKTLAADNNGDVWVAFNDGTDKIKKYDPTTNTFSCEVAIGSTINDLKAVSGKVYVGTNNGLYVFDCTASPEIATVTNNATSATLETVAISTASYQWYYSEVDPATLRITTGSSFTAIDGANSNTYEATTSGYYLVEITNNDIVNKSKILHVQINTNALSTLDPATDASLVVYPNPFSDIINLKSPYTINKVIARDVNGNSELFDVSGSEIQINPTMKGLLFLEIHTNNGIFTQKIIQK